MAGAVKQGKRGVQGKVGPRWRDSDISKMDSKLDRLVEAIYEGNGQRSLMERTARIEENVETMLAASTHRDESISKMSGAMVELTSCVNEHHKTFHLSKLFSNWKFYPAAIAAYLVLHNLANAIGRPLLSWLLELLKVPLPGWLL
jgi:hypothetical protein